jgi:hypothetical protein
VIANKLMILVPALNEEEAVGDVVRAARRAMPSASVLVVDDHSRDATARVAAEAGAHVVRLPAHRGLGGCLRAGYQHALEMGYEYVIRLDGDGQHEAADIPGMLAALESVGTDVVIGSRFVEDGAYKSSLMRSIGIALFRRLLAPVLGKTIYDPTSGFIGVKRDVIRIFAEHLPGVYPEIGGLIMLRRNDFRFHELACRMYPRRTGRSSFTLLKSTEYTLRVLAGLLNHALRPPVSPGRKVGYEIENK